MYAWIWRRLPFRSARGKAMGSLVLVGLVVALLWYVIFPWAEPLLPFDDVQVGDPESGFSQLDEPGVSPVPTGLQPTDPPPGTGTPVSPSARAR